MHQFRDEWAVDRVVFEYKFTGCGCGIMQSPFAAPRQEPVSVDESSTEAGRRAGNDLSVWPLDMRKKIASSQDRVRRRLNDWKDSLKSVSTRRRRFLLPTGSPQCPPSARPLLGTPSRLPVFHVSFEAARVSGMHSMRASAALNHDVGQGADSIRRRRGG